MAKNSSVIVSDEQKGVFAFGYQHNNGELTYQSLIESAIAANDEWDGEKSETLSPVDFLAEWHTLSLQKWESPSDVTVKAIDNLSDMARSDEFHYEVQMDNGFIDSITCFKSDVQVFEILFS